MKIQLTSDFEVNDLLFLYCIVDFYVGSKPGEFTCQALYIRAKYKGQLHCMHLLHLTREICNETVHPYVKGSHYISLVILHMNVQTGHL